MGDRLGDWVERLNRERAVTRGRLTVSGREHARLTLTCAHGQTDEPGLDEALVAELGLLAVKAVCLDALEPDQDARVIECKFDYQHPIAGGEFKAKAHLIRQGRSILVVRAEVISVVAGETYPLAIVQASLMAAKPTRTENPDQS